MDTSRRGFLQALGLAAVAGPAVVKAAVAKLPDGFMQQYAFFDLAVLTSNDVELFSNFGLCPPDGIAFLVNHIGFRFSEGAGVDDAAKLFDSLSIKLTVNNKPLFATPIMYAFPEIPLFTPLRLNPGNTLGVQLAGEKWPHLEHEITARVIVDGLMMRRV